MFKNYQNYTSITDDFYQSLMHMNTKKIDVTKKLVALILKEFNVSLKKNEENIFFINIFLFVSQKKIGNTWKPNYLEQSNLSDFERYDVNMYNGIQNLNALITEDTKLRGYEFSSYSQMLKLNALILGTENRKDLKRHKEVIIFYNSQMGLNHEAIIQSNLEKIIVSPIIWASKLTERVDIIVTDKLALEFLKFQEKILMVNILPTEKDITKLKEKLNQLNKEEN